MATVIFNRDTLKVTDIDRELHPYEVGLKNANIEGLTKSVPYFVKEKKTDVNGNQLYLLPQKDKKIDNFVTNNIKTTEKLNADGTERNPVTFIEYNKVPLLDETGAHAYYYRQELGEVINATKEDGTANDPVMITVENADGTTSEVQKEDDQGRPLYWDYVNIGGKIYCYTVEEITHHEKDELGNLLYWTTEQVNEPTYEPQPPLEITSEDINYTEDLPEALKDVERFRTATFKEEPELFTYIDILKTISTEKLKDTFYDNITTFEEPEKVMDTALSTFQADLGTRLVSIPAGGGARTVKLTLPEIVTLVRIDFEASTEGLKVEIGRLASNLITIDSRNEVTLDTGSSEVYVRFSNPTTKRIDLTSFALLT